MNEVQLTFVKEFLILEEIKWQAKVFWPIKHHLCSARMKKMCGATVAKFLSFSRIKNSISSNSNLPDGVDVREEYANAFRTESYNQFWARVVAFSNPNGDAAVTYYYPAESTSTARLPSYRLFAEYLLDPDQPTVNKMLDLAHNPSKTHSLLSRYFVATSVASQICGLLLKDIDQTRIRYRSLKTTVFKSLKTDNKILSGKKFSTKLKNLNNFLNPFKWSAPSPSRVKVTQKECTELLKQLEWHRHKSKAKLRLRIKLEGCSALLLVALTASLTVIVVTHALAFIVATPSLIMASLRLASTKRLAKTWDQLDAAAKGTYILIKDLETICRLVARLDDELEHVRATIKLWVEKGVGWVQANGQVVQQLKVSEGSFSQQLDDLEEHLYLCFITINKSRNLVLKEITNPCPSR